LLLVGVSLPVANAAPGPDSSPPDAGPPSPPAEPSVVPLESLADEDEDKQGDEEEPADGAGKTDTREGEEKTASSNDEESQGDDAKDGDEGEGDGDGGKTRDEETKQIEEEAEAQEGLLGTLAEPGTVNVQETMQAHPEDVERPPRLGPARIVVDEQGDRLTLGFATQLYGRSEQRFRGPFQEEGSDGGIGIRRLRFVLGSWFLRGKIRSSLQLNLSPNALELIDVWILYAPLHSLALRIGQFKVPYTRYRLQSFAALSLADWSPITRMFGAERQIGVELLNPQPESTAWEYGLGVFTGTNVRASHAVGLSQVYGEDPINRSDLREFNGPSSLHPEVIGRAARNFGSIDTAANTDFAGGPFRSSFGVSGAVDIQPVLRQDLSARVAAEWLVKVHHLHLNLVGHMGWFGRPKDIGPWGMLGELGYRLDRHWELAARYSRIWIGRRLQRDAAAYADRRVTEAPNGDALLRYALVGRVSATNQVAAALTLYVVGHSFKTQLEAKWQGDETEDGLRQSLVTQLQLQFQY
jgi:hypothetical protein